MENEKIIDVTTEALRMLSDIRDIMLDLVPDVLTGKDFDHINALEKQLMEIQAKFAPENKPFSWSEFVGTNENN